MNPIANWSSGDVIANGLRIHYYRSGGDGPSVVLAHGITDSGECWPQVAPVLAEEFDVITYDARGHGLSETPRAPYSSVEQADDLAGLIGALGLEQPCLVGHSMGASTVSVAAARHPGLMRAIVLEDPPWRDVPQEQTRSRIGGYGQRLQEYQSMTVEELVAFGRENRLGWDVAEFEPWAVAKHRCRAEALAQMTGLGPPWREVAAQIQCPTLLITGDAEVQSAAGLGAIVTPQATEEALGLLRDGRMVHIPGAGHNIRREGFEGYMEAVLAFLREQTS
jgi:N-formylmaleamate deformylase